MKWSIPATILRVTPVCLVAALASCGDPLCENTIASRAALPDGSYVYIVTRDCGATTAAATFVYLSRKGDLKQFRMESGDIVFLAEAPPDKVSVTAKGEHAIGIEFSGDATRIFVNRSCWEDLTVDVHQTSQEAKAEK